MIYFTDDFKATKSNFKLGKETKENKGIEITKVIFFE